MSLNETIYFLNNFKNGNGLFEILNFHRFLGESGWRESEGWSEIRVGWEGVGGGRGEVRKEERELEVEREGGAAWLRGDAGRASNEFHFLFDCEQSQEKLKVFIYSFFFHYKSDNLVINYRASKLTQQIADFM